MTGQCEFRMRSQAVIVSGPGAHSLRSGPEKKDSEWRWCNSKEVLLAAAVLQELKAFCVNKSASTGVLQAGKVLLFERGGEEVSAASGKCMGTLTLV